MARLAELLRQGTSVPTELQSMNLWAKIEVQEERPRPRFSRNNKRAIDAFREAQEARPSRKHVAARVTKCAPSSYVGAVRRGYDVIVCKKSVLE